jgi:hypothetical protein
VSEPGNEGNGRETALRWKLDAELLEFVDKAEHGNGHPIGVRGRVKMGSLYFATLALVGVFLLIAASEPKLHGRYVEAVGWAFLLVLGAFLGWYLLKALGRLIWRLVEIAIEPVRKSRVDALAAENKALKKKLAEYAPITDGGYRIVEACEVGEDTDELLNKVMDAHKKAMKKLVVDLNGAPMEAEASGEAKPALTPISTPALTRSKTKEWGTGT